MTSILHCDLRLLPSPFPQRDEIDVWGEIRLSIESDDGHVPLLVWQWDLDLLADWYCEGVESVCHQELIIKGERSSAEESLAEALDRFREREFADDEMEAEDRWFDAIYNYYEQHGLWRGLSGARIPDIILGCHRGAGEISLSAWKSKQTDYEDNPLPADAYARLEGWSYRFDMTAFLTQLHADLRRILTEWLNGNRDPRARERVEELLQRLPGVPCTHCCGDSR